MVSMKNNETSPAGVSENEALSLGKFLALYGGLSRRAAVTAVKDGRVEVNSLPETNPARKVSSGDQLKLDGKSIQAGNGRKYYYMLNKPRGYLCSNYDPHCDKLACSLLPAIPGVRLFSAGRLDKDSEGLIIFSNDGDYVERIAHPRYGICKRYLVELSRHLSEAGMATLCRGITDAGETLRALAIEPVGGRKYLMRERSAKYAA